EKAQPDHPLVLEWKRRSAQRATPVGQNAIDRVRQLLGPRMPPTNTASLRQLIEHTAIVDTLTTTSCEEAAADLVSIGDSLEATNLRAASEFAHRELGISQFKIVSDFPIALCGIGYTRITRDPNRSILTPFEALNSDGRIPLYTVT